MTVSVLSRGESTVPGDYMVTTPTCIPVPSEFYTSENTVPSQTCSGKRGTIAEQPAVPTPRPCASQDSGIHNDTWRSRMESLMPRRLNARQSRPQEQCNQSINNTSPSPASSVSLGACVRGRCEGFACVAAPPMSPMPPHKAQCHQDTSQISLSNQNSPQSPYRCHMRSQSDLPAPHTFSERRGSQKVTLPSVDLSISQNPARWNSSPRFPTSRHVAGGVSRPDRSTPSPVRCSTPSLASGGCVSPRPIDSTVSDVARSELVSSCVQWIHDPAPSWPALKTPQARTLAAVQREVGFETGQLPTTMPQRQPVVANVQWYPDCVGSSRNVRRQGEGTMTTKATYSPTLNARVRCCQSQVNNGAVCLHSVPARSSVGSPTFKVKFVKGETQCVPHQSAPPAPIANSIRIPENPNTTPPKCSVPF